MKTFFLILLLIFSFSLHAQTPCPSGMVTAEMDRMMIESLKESQKDQPIRIAIFPFQDGSLNSVDPVLEKGFAYAIYNLMRFAPKSGVYHPFTVLNELSVQNMTDQDYFVAARVLPLARNIEATHAVIGMFQKKGSVIRFFVQILDVAKNEPVGTIIEMTTEESDRFFGIASDVTQTILQRLNAGKIDSDFIKTYQKNTPVFEAFRYYVKGMDKSASYKEVDLGVAKVWFEKATSLSYKFAEGFEEKARTLFMLALLQKAAFKDISMTFGEAQKTLDEATVINKKLKSNFQPAIVWRWYNGHLAYVDGLKALAQGNSLGANTSLKLAIGLLPEDARAHDAISQAGGGQQESEVARRLGVCR